MQIVCPNCSARFSFDEEKITGQGVKLRCGKCRAVFRAMRKGSDIGIVLDARTAEGKEKIKLIVANESAAFCQAVQKVLAGEPIEVIVFNDGLAAMKGIEAEKPAAVLLDVALPSMYGFEICEEVRRNRALDNVKLILVASIYDKTKYKRTPTSLYGADAYIEKHHIPDSLAALIKKLVSGVPDLESTAASTSGVTDPLECSKEITARVTHDMTESSKEDLTRDELPASNLSGSISPAEDFSEFSVKAKRLARIIVSDILLYNQGKVMEGIRNGNFYELLKDEIREGKSLYARRVPAEVAAEGTFLDDAFEQLISSKRHEMGL